MMVSIVIPTYNRGELIKETLDSIASQTYADWECIVIDDGSTDNTQSVVEGYSRRDSRFQFYERPKQRAKGANACRNYGIEVSNGKYLIIFDSDDLMLPMCLDGRVALMEKEPCDMAIFSMGVLMEGKDINYSHPKIYNDGWEQALSVFLTEGTLPWNLQRTMYRSTFIKGKISFNEQLLRFQDIEFNVRVLHDLRPRFISVSDVDCYYRYAGIEHPRSEQFYTNVFKAVPVFIASLHHHLSDDFFRLSQVRFGKQWFLSITRLYARKSVKKEYFTNARDSIDKYIGLSFRQRLILYLVFGTKKYFRGKKGQGIFIKALTRAYVE